MLICLYLVFRPNLKIKVDFKDEQVEFTGKRYLTLGIFVAIALC